MGDETCAGICFIGASILHRLETGGAWSGRQSWNDRPQRDSRGMLIYSTTRGKKKEEGRRLNPGKEKRHLPLSDPMTEKGQITARYTSRKKRDEMKRKSLAERG